MPNQDVKGLPMVEDGRRPQIPNAAKSEPSYADGYYMAFQGDPFDTDRSGDEAYAYGFEAGNRARSLFLANGFSASRKGFRRRLRMPATGQDTSNA